MDEMVINASKGSVDQVKQEGPQVTARSPDVSGRDASKFELQVSVKKIKKHFPLVTNSTNDLDRKFIRFFFYSHTLHLH